MAIKTRMVIFYFSSFSGNLNTPNLGQQLPDAIVKEYRVIGHPSHPSLHHSKI